MPRWGAIGGAIGGAAQKMLQSRKAGKTSKTPQRSAGVPITGIGGATGITFGGGGGSKKSSPSRNVIGGGIFRKSPKSKRSAETPQRQGLSAGKSVGRALGVGMFSSPVVSAMEEPFGRSLVRGHHSRAKRSAPRRGASR